MDWSNESYVRLYVRDTTSWMRLGWDGQCCLMALLRKADRAGAIDLDDLEPWEAVMLQTGAPEGPARTGTAALIRVGVLEVRGKILVFPNYIEAQECSKSDRLRQQESRARRACGNYPLTPQVTDRDPSKSQNVTDGHDRSQPVTIGHSLPCSALPSLASPTLVYEQDTQKPTLAVIRPIPAHGAFEDAPALPQQIVAKFRNLHMHTFSVDPNMSGKNVHGFPSQLENTAKLRSVDPLALLEDCFRAWAERPRDKWAKSVPYASFVGAFGSLVAALGSPDDHWPGFSVSAPVGDRYASSKPYVPTQVVEEQRDPAEVARDTAELVRQIKARKAATT
jgi:hypothetical protein